MPIWKSSYRTTVFTCVVILFASSLSLAQEARGLKFNNLAVSPYVNVEAAYDSNVNYNRGVSGRSSQQEVGDSIMTISPGVDLTYTGNDWGLEGNAWYGYDRYTDEDQLNNDRYGESLKFYRESSKGWRLVLGQSYLKDSQNDSIIDGGNGLWRDRELFGLNGALSYQLSEKTGITLSGMYSDLTYVNDPGQYDPLYGWQEYSVGLEVARKLTEKSNLLVSGSYQEYISDSASSGPATKQANDSSTGYSLMAGLGSRATERIRYRAVTGVNLFEYAGGEQLTGWAYSLDGSWVINKKLAASIQGSSNFQPSESQANQAVQVYTLSTGLTYRPMRRLTARVDLAVRREEEQIESRTTKATKDDQYSIRTRADYELNRYVTLYGGLEYTDQNSDDKNNEFERYRGSLGLNFRY